jgi:endo-1,4-beta-xylanase
MKSRILTLLLALAASAAPAQSIPQGGLPVFPGDPLAALVLVGNQTALGKAELVPVTGPLPAGATFTQALRLTTTAQAESAWSVQVAAPCPVKVGLEETLYVDFWIRSVSGGTESAEGRTIFCFEKNGDPWTKSAESDVTAGRDWKHFYLPFNAALPTPEGGSHICFRMGFAPQTIELAGMRLLHYGQAVDLAKFPKMVVTYAGREKDASWRQEALARIEKIRKADLRVVVVGKDGKPKSGISVEAKMLRHRFYWGTAVQAQRLAGNGQDGEQYKDEIPKWFNHVVFENDLKWPFWEPGLTAQSGWNQTWVDESLKWLAENHLTVRGHNLVWPSWRNSPTRLQALKGDKEGLRKAIREHVLQEAGYFKGKLTDWDAINEPYAEHDFMDLLGPGLMVDIFKWAHEADPKAKLYLNEYGIFSGGGADKGHQDSFFNNLTYLKEQGAPIGGLGIQSHLGTTLTPPQTLLSLLDRFGTLGLDIQITEFDIEPDPDVAYDYMRDYLTVVFSHPKVVGMLMWGFWDGAHWHNAAPIFTKDWELKPTGKAYRDLVLGAWWTNAKGKTGDDGIYSVRGFQGDYSLKVGGKTQEISLSPGGSAVTVVR